MKPVISPRELAEAIGVSESSLKRWANDGLIRVSKTAGGHRRIAIGEAVRFIRAVGAPLVRPDLLGIGDLPSFNAELLASESPSDRLFQHLAEGRAREARSLILSLYLGGKSVAEIADGPIRNAMTRLGEIWTHSPAGIFIEHRATDICVQAVQELRLLIDPPASRFAAVGGAPPGDPYILASLLAATALTAEGGNAINLGADTPFDTLLMAAEHHAARFMWLSVGMIARPDELCAEIVQLAARFAERGGSLMVGGYAAGRLPIRSSDHVRVGDSIAALVAAATELYGGAAETPDPARN